MTQSSSRDLGAVSHFDALLATVGPVAGLNIIDIGCGEGRLTRALAALGARVTGCDPFIAETAWTEHGAGSYRLVKAAADAIPEPDHQADLVLFVFSLHHVPGEKLEAALAEARRVLRPSGRLYVAEPLAQGPHHYVVAPFHDETAVRQAAAAALDTFCPAAFRGRRGPQLRRSAKLCRFRQLCRPHDRQHAVQRLHQGSRAGAGSASPLRRDERGAWRPLRSAGSHRLLHVAALALRRRKLRI